MLTDLGAAVRDLVRGYLIADPNLAGSFTEDSEVTEANPLPTGHTLYEVRSWIQKGDLPEERHVVTVKVREAPSPITVLKDCIIEVTVGSPADVEGIEVENHALLERAVERCWDKKLNPTAAADLSTAIEAALPGWTGADFFAEGWQEAREETELLPVYTVKVGVQKLNP